MKKVQTLPSSFINVLKKLNEENNLHPPSFTLSPY